MYTLSVVSHRQGHLVARLLDDVAAHCSPAPEVLVVVNVPEDETYLRRQRGLRVKVLRNDEPRGFGSNHNMASRLAAGDVFIVANPDVRLTSDPLPTLAATVREAGAGICAPRVLSPAGVVEDSARRFPTIGRILRRRFENVHTSDYDLGCGGPVEVDWVAGIFLAIRRDVFQKLRGFDERYFMYYEDVDLCRRVRAAGLRVLVEPSVTVIHDARRASHRDLRHLVWHMRSTARYLWGEWRALRRLK